MVLNLPIGLDRFDVKGLFIKECTIGSKKGKMIVEVNSVQLHKDKSELMCADLYFDIYHKRVAGELPANASGRLWEVSHSGK